MARRQARVGYGVPTLLAVGLHVLVLLFSVISLPTREHEPSASSIVQATLVSTETVTDQAQRAEEARQRALARQAAEEAAAQEEQRQAAEEAATQEAQRQSDQAAEEQAREAARQAAEAEAVRRAEEAEAETRRLQQQRDAEAEAQREREAEAQRRREEEAAQQREAEEQARREEEAEAQRRREEEAARQREAEEQARREQEAEAQRRREEEAARQREAEEQARLAREQAEAEMQRLIEGADERVANAQQGQQAANDFIALVRRAVEQAWRIPPNISSGATAEISVRLGPSGELFVAEVSRSSGDSAFDRSAVQAVEAAAPFAELRQLPAGVQRDYRQFNLRFRPGDVR
ncbi:cell envelope integrity protein TolA [Halomonas icarae]|uniref:Cell envelope integrity protein TolA n=1 Tax=Halomonas icarae TaxID=2691040 RepID=A0A7X4VY40_9GAMM|nr:cell envelope integrity protein TolA [Halomonas icarae]MDR5902130.1 cell envelope integrity protein TolA [Halomonas icarae]NAW12170.1 cell envelope integrity protein TolA [Halomonas icarae]